MFGVDSGELFIIVLVAVVVIGPKDLPRVMRTVGHWIGKARGMANQFRSGVDQMVRESEIADLEKKWREQNDAIMRAHPAAPADTDWGLPTPAPPPPDPEPVSLEADAPNVPVPIEPVRSAAASGPRPVAPGAIPPLLKPGPAAPRPAQDLP